MNEFEEKPFSCEECDGKFTTKHDLQIHNRTHCTGRKLFTCRVCKKKITGEINLNNHIKTHSGESPLTCEVCECHSDVIRF